MSTVYIQQNTIVPHKDLLEDGIAIEVEYILYITSDTYESHGLHYVSTIDIDVLSAAIVIVMDGKIVCSGDVGDLTPIEVFLSNNAGLL